MVPDAFFSFSGANRTEKKPRRRKKHFRGFCFWMKQTFFSCSTAKVEDPG